MSGQLPMPPSMIPHWTGSGGNTLGASTPSYSLPPHGYLTPVQRTLDTVSTEPFVTGAVDTDTYFRMVNLSNKQVVVDTVVGMPHPWLSTVCSPCRK